MNTTVIVKDNVSSPQIILQEAFETPVTLPPYHRNPVLFIEQALLIPQVAESSLFSWIRGANRFTCLQYRNAQKTDKNGALDDRMKRHVDLELFEAMCFLCGLLRAAHLNDACNKALNHRGDLKNRLT